METRPAADFHVGQAKYAKAVLPAEVLAELHVGNAISAVAATLRPRLVLRLEVSCPVLLPVIALLALLHALLWLRALLLLSPLLFLSALRLFALYGRCLAGVLLLPSALLLVLLCVLLLLPVLLACWLRMMILLVLTPAITFVLRVSKTDGCNQ